MRQHVFVVYVPIRVVRAATNSMRSRLICDSPAANYLVNSLDLTLYMSLHVKSRLPRRPKCRELVTNRCYMYLGLMSQHIGELVPVMNVIIHFLRDCTLE